MKASLGTSTLPMSRIFFFPSACFFSSFIFRVMSPPYCQHKLLFNSQCLYTTPTTIVRSEKKNFTYTFSQNIFSERLNPERQIHVHFKHSKSMFICRANSYTYFASLCHVIKILRSLLFCLRFSCDDLTSNGCLNSDLKHLPGYGVFQALTHGFACAVCTVSAKQKTSIKYNG